MNSDPNNHTGVILAAGRGSRLNALTEARPKCLVELAGRPLLEWQVMALTKAGVKSINVVTGYQKELIEKTNLPTIYNHEWSSSNMVASLALALDALQVPFIVSYSDIVYSHELIIRLLQESAPVAITYDRKWFELWRRRFDDPLSDAESFRIDAQNRITEIGKKVTNAGQIQGQFMGLIKISEEGVRVIKALLKTNPKLKNTMDSTGLLSFLIEKGVEIVGVPTEGNWCEIDNRSDLEVAEYLMSEGLLNICE